MKDIEYWKKNGFSFEKRFNSEYDLWLNLCTKQKLRRYADGREFLSDLTTGEYKLVDETTTGKQAKDIAQEYNHHVWFSVWLVFWILVVFLLVVAYCCS